MSKSKRIHSGLFVIAGVLAIVFFASIFASSAVAYQGGDWPAYEPELSASESCFLAKWNDYREDEGLEPISVTDDLNKEADGRANYLYEYYQEHDYESNSHELLDESGLIDSENDMPEIFYSWWGYNYEETINHALSAWKDSHGHDVWLRGKKIPLGEEQKGILPEYSTAGIGQVMPQDGERAIWIVVFYKGNSPGSDLGQGDKSDCAEVQSSSDQDENSSEETAISNNKTLKKIKPNLFWQSKRRGRKLFLQLRNAPLLNSQTTSLRLRKQVLRCNKATNRRNRTRRCRWNNRGRVRIWQQSFRQRPITLRVRASKRQRNVLIARTRTFTLGSMQVKANKAVIICSRRCRTL